MNKKIIFSAFLFYLLIIPLFYHPDIKEIFYKAHFLSKGVVDIYTYFELNPKMALFGPFAYAPLTYFLYGFYFIPVNILAGNSFVNWLFMGNDAVEVAKIYRYLFTMKMLGVFALLGSGYIITKDIVSEKLSKWILLFLFLNPISIYVVGFMGQFDILVVFLMVLSLYYSRKNPVLASVFLGIGAAMKNYPLLLIPFLAVLASAKPTKQIRIAAAGLVCYGIFVLPFLGKQSFYDSTIVSGLSLRIFQLGVSVGTFKIPLIPIALAVLFLFAWKFDKGKTKKLYSYYFAALFITVAGVDFHPQWALWFVPFLTLVVATYYKVNRKLITIATVLIFIGWAGKITLMNDKFLVWGIFSVLDPGVLFLPNVNSIVENYLNSDLLKNAFRIVFASGGYILIYKSLYEKNRT